MLLILQSLVTHVVIRAGEAETDCRKSNRQVAMRVGVNLLLSVAIAGNGRQELMLLIG